MIKLFKNLSKKDMIEILFCIIFIVLQVWLDLKMPDYMSKITVLVQTEGSTMNDIIKNGIYMILCALGSLVFAVMTGYLAANVSSNFSKTTRKKIFDKTLDLDADEVKKFSTSSLITRTTNDVTQIETLLALGLQLLVKAPITAVWAITKIMHKSWQWSAITGVAVLILLAVITMLIIVVIPRFKLVQQQIDNLNGIARENLTGIRVVRAFNAENYQEKKFDKSNKKLTDLQLFNQKKFAMLLPIMYLIMYLLTLSIYFVGAYLIRNSLMANKISLFGDMIVFSSYAMQIIFSFLMLAMIFMILPRAQVSAKRINEVLDTKKEIIPGIENPKTKETGTVEFQNVSFKYPNADEYILKDISFKVNQGETIAFIGSTGSGKSTLINLVPRFYDVTSGKVLIDGIDVKKYTEKSLNNKIGYVPQKAVLFSGSVNYNVSYGSKIKEDKIKQAIKVSQAKDFVEKMDNKYKTHIAQGGTNISGGQKQRLAIARAIAKNPEIYIFDDSFSALDYKTDATLRKELKKYTKEATSLIVAQRIGTIMTADKIVVLDNGKCVGFGTHKELLKNCEVYKEIALSQLSKEELENV
jgi:ATP-binding cassette subfamily B protein